ncbi:hotdog family protein [Photobacterium japonica]|uniref:hotdog family protein n=1 Tax=Photobacterium japonica TaxID=2910235 RepID=UPI003D0B0D29
MTNIPPLSDLLPHDMPMVLVDTLVEVSAFAVHCQVTVHEGGLFFDAERRELPGYVGIELMAQTIGGWSGYHAWCRGEVSPVGFLLGSRRYQTACAAFPEHSVLDIYAEQVLENNGMAVFACRIEQQGQVLATSQLNVFVPSPEKLDHMLNRNPS